MQPRSTSWMHNPEITHYWGGDQPPHRPWTLTWVLGQPRNPWPPSVRVWAATGERSSYPAGPGTSLPAAGMWACRLGLSACQGTAQTASQTPTLPEAPGEPMCAGAQRQVTLQRGALEHDCTTAETDVWDCSHKQRWRNLKPSAFHKGNQKQSSLEGSDLF